MYGRRICVNISKQFFYNAIAIKIEEEKKNVQRNWDKRFRSERQILFLEKLKRYSFQYFPDVDYYKKKYKNVDYENYETYCNSVEFFRKNMKKIATIFIAEKYSHIYFAVLHNKNLEDLFLEFDKWFIERKKKFMEKMKMEIAQVKSLSQHRVSGQHGSVASLLKVLTKTMNQQGADIRSVAKMQYLVCVQAGIYVPDEFITDVAVFSDFESEFEKSVKTIQQEEQDDIDEHNKKRDEYLEELKPQLQEFVKKIEAIQREQREQIEGALT